MTELKPTIIEQPRVTALDGGKAQEAACEWCNAVQWIVLNGLYRPNWWRTFRHFCKRDGEIRVIFWDVQ